MAIKCPQCGAEYDVTLFTFAVGFTANVHAIASYVLTADYLKPPF